MLTYEDIAACKFRRQRAERDAATLRSKMIEAEDAGDVAAMRRLQSLYHMRTGAYFETTLAWR